MFRSDYWEHLEDFVRERMALKGTPGVAVAVVQGSELVFAAGFGVTSGDPVQATAVTPATVFRIGSTSKPLTGTLLMRLVEAGKLALDEPIVTYLPWFTLSDSDAARRVALRHLMSHQSGLPWGAQFFGRRDPEGLERYVREQVPRFPLLAPPGVLFAYSNVGMNVAGCVAEAVCGEYFADLMNQWVFEPLGMTRTTYDPLHALTFPLAQAHEKADGTVRVKRGEPWAENTAYRPSAMAFSTVLDISRLARLYLNRGEWEGQRMLSPESIAEMHRTQVDEFQRDGRTVGLNFALTRYRGYRRVGHPGGISSFGSYFSLLPDIGIGVALQYNESAFWPEGEAVCRHIFGAALEGAASAATFVSLPAEGAVEPAPLSVESLAEALLHHVGTYLGPQTGLVRVTLSADGGTLSLSRGGAAGETILTPLRENLYAGRREDGEEDVVGFITQRGAAAGTAITHLMVNGSPCARVTPNPEFTPRPAVWEEYAGEWEGPDETFASGRDRLRLRIAEGQLRVHSQNRGREEEAVAWNHGVFIYRGQFLRFAPEEIDGEGVDRFFFGDALYPYCRVFA